MFDDLPALVLSTATYVADEITLYLSTGPEPVKDVLAWWYEKRTVYPTLSRMALDYLSIPGESLHAISTAQILTNLATSVDVERVFSRGRLLLSHVRSRLSVQSTRALLCVGSWSLLGLVKDEDVLSAAMLADINEDIEDLYSGWDAVKA
jgi:hypothetical protein